MVLQHKENLYGLLVLDYLRHGIYLQGSHNHNGGDDDDKEYEKQENHALLDLTATSFSHFSFSFKKESICREAGAIFLPLSLRSLIFSSNTKSKASSRAIA